MKTKLAGLVSLGALLCTSAALAKTYKVGPSQTYKQLTEIDELLQPGDLVEIDGDATYAGGAIFSNAGTAAAKITVRGLRVNGKRPVISGATNTIEAQGDHYVFEGLELTQGSFRCFYHHADDITLRDSVIHDCPKHGLLGADADSGSLLLEYVEVYKCGGGTFDHQIYMATDETAHPKSVFRMQHCYVHDANGGNNVKSRAERNEIYFNFIQGAMYHELELIGPDGQDENLAREDSDVVGNVLVKTATTFVARFGGDGTGQTFGRYRLVNNTVVTQPGGSAVFRLFDGIDSVEMHNNVFWTTGSGTPNLVRTTEASWKAGSAIAGSNNYVKAGATNVPKEWSATLEGTDPGFVDAAGLDFHLAAGSGVIDKGTSALAGPAGHDFPPPLGAALFHPPVHALEAVGAATPRPMVGTIDIGAYEFGTGPAAGGTSGTGGSATGGSGASTAGGAGGAGGASGGAPSTGGASTGGKSAAKSGSDSNCGCRTGSGSTGGAWTAAGLAVWAGLRRRRRAS